MLFATGLGAGGDVVAALSVGCVGLVCYGGSLTAVIWSVLMLTKGRRKRRWPWVLMLVAGVLVPMSCLLGPPISFRLTYGRGPLDRRPTGVIDQGMTPEEVRARLGPPHKIDGHDPERWCYYYGWDVLPGSYIVYFDPDGRVDFAGSAD